ncbi:formin-like [Glandiceps talaboti]
MIPLHVHLMFLLQLSDINCFAERVYCILFQTTFQENVTAINEKLATIGEICQDLESRESVQNILRLILCIGNYLNGGSRTRGQADGFGLDILSKIKDVKSADNSTNLLSFLVKCYIAKFDSDAGTEKTKYPLPQPSAVSQAALIKFDELHKEWKKTGKDLNDCEKKIIRIVENSEEDQLQPFKDNMENFIISAKEELLKLEINLQCFQQKFDQAVKFFCVQPKSGDKEVTPAYFFGLWFPFCRDFKTEWKKEQQKITRRNIEEAQRKTKQIQEEKRRSFTTSAVKAGGLKAKVAAAKAK